MPPVVSVLRHSESIATIAVALVRAQGRFPIVLRESTNEQFNSMFADMASLVKATRKPLIKNGIVVLQAPSLNVEEQTLTITTRLLHQSAEWFEADMSIPILDEDWEPGKVTGQVVSSTVSYCRRIAYKSILGIADADDDGNLASGRGKEKLPPDYKRTDGKRPGVHLETAKGELLEVREGSDT